MLTPHYRTPKSSCDLYSSHQFVCCVLFPVLPESLVSVRAGVGSLSMLQFLLCFITITVRLHPPAVSIIPSFHWELKGLLYKMEHFLRFSSFLYYFMDCSSLSKMIVYLYSYTLPTYSSIMKNPAWCNQIPRSQ